MRDNLTVLKQTRDFVRSGFAIALPEPQRRVAGVVGLNVVAVGLAFAALHIGGVIVAGNSVPSVAAADPRAVASAMPAVAPSQPSPVAAPIPRRAPAVQIADAAMPTAALLFDDPVLAPTSFVSAAPSSGFNSFVVPPTVAVPPPVAVAAPPATAAPAPVAKVVHAKAVIAKAVVAAKVRHRAVVAPHYLRAAVPTHLVDNSGGADVGSQAAAIGAGIGNGISAAAGSATSTATGVTAGVAGGVGGAVGGVGSAVSSAVGAVGGVAGSVGVR